MGSASRPRRGIKARFVATALVTVILAGCAVGPNYKRPPIVPPEETRGQIGPRGTLRDVLRPTSSGPPITDDAIKTVLDDLGAAGVLACAGSLNQEHDWQKLVGLGEQQFVTLARVALARPEFAFLYRVDELLSAADMARVLHTLTARSITYVTFSDSDALAAEHDVVLCLEAGGAWNLSADSRGITA